MRQKPNLSEFYDFTIKYLLFIGLIVLYVIVLI